MTYEIWLGDHYSHFDSGIAHFDNGRTTALDSCIHTATYGSDSVLIDDVEHIDECRFPLRWFIKSEAIDFYSIGEDTPDILFHNESEKDIRIDKYGLLKSRDSVSIKMNNRKNTT